MPNPFIQIGNETREMTDDEFAEYQEATKDAKLIDGYVPLDIPN